MHKLGLYWRLACQSQRSNRQFYLPFALTASGCAACLGIHQGLLAADEVCLSSTNRNFPGRMGSVKGRIYLGSPASVAAAARNGVVTDPRQYLDEKGEQA